MRWILPRARRSTHTRTVSPISRSVVSDMSTCRSRRASGSIPRFSHSKPPAVFAPSDIVLFDFLPIL